MKYDCQHPVYNVHFDSRTITKCRSNSGFSYEFHIPFQSGKIIKMRSDVHLHYFFIWIELKTRELAFFQARKFKAKSQKIRTPQKINAMVLSLIQCFIKTLN